MYAAETLTFTPAIARFESWLRSHGYEPARDPFVPAPEANYEMSEDAAELVGDYLRDRPGEAGNRDALIGHALQVGPVAAVWGDSGVLAF
jgi:hypothetical protein